MKTKPFIGGAFIILLVMAVSADDNLLCTGIHSLTCPIGATQDNITLFNVTTGNSQVLETSQISDLGLWNASFNFASEGKYCARCDTTNTSTCFDIVDYCQENIDTNIDAIQEDIGDPSGSGTTLFALINQVYLWIQTNIVNRVNVRVA